ncbi:hydrogenase maturation protease, partial [Streptomyces sp. NPDC093225]|uniref:hydrogenase maturation protease n=1 Tax=Streptomyces sp. NPDC093225 TaxID=3366034 RepID=UPI003808B0F1
MTHPPTDRSFPPPVPARRRAVIGIGNEFRRDDGVGWAVVAVLRARAARRRPPDTVLAQCDGDPGRLLELWTDTELVIIVDALFPPAPQPGRVHRWEAAERGELLPDGPGRQSTHGLGLSEALRLGAALGRGPGRLIVYAVEGGDRSVGPGMTPEVVAAVPRVVRRVEADIGRHGTGECPRPPPPPGGGRAAPPPPPRPPPPPPPPPTPPPPP